MKILGMRWNQIEYPTNFEIMVELKVEDNQGNIYFVDDFNCMEFDDFYVAAESLLDYFENEEIEKIDKIKIEYYGMENGIMPLAAIQSDFCKIFALLHMIVNSFDETISAEEYIKPLLNIEL